MKIHEKYLEALKTSDDFITVSEWAIKVGKSYPDLLKEANEQAKNHKNKTTGVNQIVARISSLIRRKYEPAGVIKVDKTERPQKVKYITEEEFDENTKKDLEEDIESLRRQDIINQPKESFEAKELYRINEFENIQKNFKKFLGIDFEIDHTKALLNDKEQGKHHPDNFQLRLKCHNVKKYNNSWQRFGIDEQIDYISKVVEVHKVIEDKLVNQNILNNLLNRLKAIYVKF